MTSVLDFPPEIHSFDDTDVLDLDPGPEPDAPGEPRLPFVEWLKFRASLLRIEGRGTAPLNWLAAKIDRLACYAELVDAETPDDLDCRVESLEEDHEERIRSEAYSAGFAAAERCYALEFAS